MTRTLRDAPTADQVRWLHDATGFTWTQLGRLFGVSHQAVRAWAGGARMRPTNARRLSDLLALFEHLPADAAPEPPAPARATPADDRPG